MTRPAWAGAILAALILLAGNGCCRLAAYRYHGDCGPEGWSGRLGNCTTGMCGQCDSCGEADGCDLTLTGRVRSAMTCGAGCGEMYWGEWAYDPPDECDPCDNCGNYVGPTECCQPGPLRTLWYGLWGARYCETCGGPCHHEHELLLDEPLEIIESQNDVPAAETIPTPPTAQRQRQSVMRRR